MTRLLSALRSPRLVVGEIGALVLCGVLMTVVPQQGPGGPAGATGLPALVPALGLDRIARTSWFLALAALSAASLCVVLSDQVRRARAEWSRVPSPGSFRAAPFRREFVRAGAPAAGTATTSIRVRGRAGLLGSPLFHLGLLLLVAAGIVRMAFGADAQVDLYEGEVLPAGPSGWGAHWTGPLARPLSVSGPVRLDAVRPESYPSGALESLEATLAVGEGGGGGETWRSSSVSVNTPLHVPGGRLFVTAGFGPTALLALERAGAPPAGVAALLREAPEGWEGGASFPGGDEVRVRARSSPGLPGTLEVRFLRGGALAWVGRLRPGDGAAVDSRTTLGLVGIRWWIRIGGTRDSSLALAFGGLLLVAAGATLMFAVVPVHEAILVEDGPCGQAVVVAIRPRRFAPLYSERFEELVRREGGPSG